MLFFSFLFFEYAYIKEKSESSGAYIYTHIVDMYIFGLFAGTSNTQ